MDRSYRSDDTEDAVTTDNPTTPFPTPPPTLVSPRSPIPLHRQASPFPMENTNTRRIHYATPQDRLRGSNGDLPRPQFTISSLFCFDFRRSHLRQQQKEPLEQHSRAYRAGTAQDQRHDFIQQRHFLQQLQRRPDTTVWEHRYRLSRTAAADLSQ